MDMFGKMDAIGNQSVVEKVIHQLTAAISSGRFKLGERLPSEFELMEELNVSRNSLREAMKILSALGVVEIRRGDGTFICSQIKPSVLDSYVYSMMLESSSTEEIVELRQTLDEDVLVLAMRKCTQANIDCLTDYIKQMRYYFSQGELSKAAKADYDFHLYLAGCAHNAFLMRIIQGVYALFEGSIEKNIRTEELFARADQHHQDIVDCLKSKDESKVPDVVKSSLSSWRENVRQKMNID